MSKELEELFISLGYTKDDYIEITKTDPLTNLKEETLFNNVKRNFDFLILLGYTKAEIIKMTKVFPAIYSYSIENMKQKIEDIMSLGYTKEEVIKMTISYPPIYTHTIENMKQKIEDIMSLGYKKEEVIKMTNTLPSLFGFSIDNIKEKIEFYDLLKMHELAVVASKMLMQSTSLSCARYMFLKDKGINIDMNNYRKLFYSNKQFEKQYGITKKELLEKYNYEEYLKENKNGRTL